MAIKVSSDRETLLSLLDDPNLAKSKAEVDTALGVTPPDQSAPARTPQTSGGSDFSAPKTQIPSDNKKNYVSSRMSNNEANYNMGNQPGRGSWSEYETAPAAYVAGFAEGTEGMVRAPFAMGAAYYNDKDTYLTHREAEGGDKVAEQVRRRSEAYKKANAASNKKKAEQLANIADSIDLYNPANVLTRREDEMISSSEKTAEMAQEGAKQRTSVRDFIEDTKADMEKVKQETGAKFTLADAAFTMGEMAPSQIAGGVAGHLISDFAKGTEYGRLMADNFITKGDWSKAGEALSNVGNLPEAATDISEAVRVATGMSDAAKAVAAANAVGELNTVGQTVGSLGTMFGQVYGNAWDEARRQGADIGMAADYALSTATVEIGTEVLGGGIPGMGGGVGTKLVQDIAEKTAARWGGQAVGKVLPTALTAVANILTSEAGEMVVDVIGEGVEEMISEVYGPLIERNSGLNPDAEDATWKDILFAGFTGSLVSVFMSGGMAVIQNARNERMTYVPRQKSDGSTKIEKILVNELYQEIVGDAGIEEAVKSGIYTPEEAADAAERLTDTVYISALISSPTFSFVQDAFREGGVLYEKYGDRISSEALAALNESVDLVKAFHARTGGLSLSAVENIPSRAELDGIVNTISSVLDTVSTGVIRLSELRKDFANKYSNNDEVSDTEVIEAFGKEIAEEERVYDRYLTTDVAAIKINGEEKFLSLPEYLDAVAKSSGLESAADFEDFGEEGKKIIEDAKKRFDDELKSTRNLTQKKAADIGLNTNLSDAKFSSFTREEQLDYPNQSGSYAYIDDDSYNGMHHLVGYNPEYTTTINNLIRILTHEVEHVTEQKVKLEYDKQGHLPLLQYDGRLMRLANRVGLDVDAVRKSVKTAYGLSDSVDDIIQLDDETRAYVMGYLLGDSSLLLDAARDDIGFVTELLDTMEARLSTGMPEDRTERSVLRKVTEETRSAVDGSLSERIDDQAERVTAPVPESIKGATEVAKQSTATKTDSVDEAVRLAEDDMPPTSAKEAEEKAEAEPIGDVFAKKQPVLPDAAKKMGFKTSVDDQKKAPSNTKTKKVGKTTVSYADDITRVELAGVPGVYVRVNQQTHKNGDVTRNLVAEADSTHPLAKNGKIRMFSTSEGKILNALGFKSKRGVWMADYNQTLWDSLVSGNAEALKSARRKLPKNDIGDLHWYKTSRNDGSEIAWIPGGEDGQGEIVLIFRDNKGFRRRANKEEYYRYVGGTKNGVTAPGLGFKRQTHGAYGNALYAPFSEELWTGFGMAPMTVGMRSTMNDMQQIRRLMFAMDGRVDCKAKGLEGYSIGYNSLNNSLELYDADGSRVGIMPYNEGIIEAALSDAPLEEIFAERSKDLQKLYDEAVNRASGLKWSHTSPELEARGDAMAEEQASAFDKAEPEAVQRSIERQLEKSDGRDVIWVKFRNNDDWQVFPRGIANELVGVTTGGKMKTTGGEYNGEKIYGPFVDPEYITGGHRVDPATGMPRQLSPGDVVEFVKDADGNMVWDASGYRTDVFYNNAQRSAEDANFPYEGIAFNSNWFKDNGVYAKAYERDLTSGVEKSKTEEPLIDEIFEAEKNAPVKAEVETPSGVTEEEYEERVGEAISDVAKRGALSEEDAHVSSENGNQQTEKTERAEKESAIASEIKEDQRREKEAKSRKKDIFKDADEGARAMMEAIAQEEEERKGTGMVVRPLYSYTMEEARQLCKGDSDAVILAKMEISKTTEKMREAAAEKDWEVYKAFKDKRDEQREMLETLRSLKPTTKTTDKVDLKDIIKPKKSKATKNEIDLAESEPFSADTVTENNAGEVKQGVEIESAYGDDVGAISEPVFNKSLMDSDGYPVRQDLLDTFNEMPGSLAKDGSVQVYYTNYIDADGTEYGDGAFVLGTDQSMIDGQSEAVYAAIRNPLFAETSKVSAYPNVRKTVTEALDYLGINPKSVKLPAFRKEANVFDIIKTAADRASEVSSISRSEIIGEILLEMGIDGIVYPDGAVVYDIEQLHQAYPSETMQTRGYSYDRSSGNVVRRSIDFTTDESIQSIRDRVNELKAKREEYIKKYGEEAYKESVRKNVGEAKEKFGTVDNKGAIPNKNVEGKAKNTTTAQNIWDSMEFDNDDTPLKDAYEELIQSGILEYVPETDESHMSKAAEWLQSFQKGTVDSPNELTVDDFAQACKTWIQKAESTMITEDDIYNGAQLIAEFANYAKANKDNPGAFPKGMIDAFQKVAALLDLTGSKAGKVLHAYKLIKNMTARGKLYYYEHMAEKLADQYDSDTGLLRHNLKNHELRGYKVPENITNRLKEIMSREHTQAEVDALEEEIIKDIADKIPPTLESRIRAYRYLCMLGNAKTHARNMASNAIMYGVKSGARVVSAGLEDIFASKVEGSERTKSLKKWNAASRETKTAARKFAREDAKRSVELLQFGGKQGFNDKVRQFQKSFGNSPVGRALEWLAQKNGGLLEAEDLIFLSKEYTAAMTWYMVANDWTPEHFRETSEQAAIDYSKAQDYALKQAWEATYRQSNLLANKLNELERSSPMAALFIEGLVPFKRTPMNILKAGLNYSAAGVINGVVKTIDMVKTGETSAAEAADSLGKGMTGTMIMILGAALAHAGMLKAGGDDDKAEEYYDQMLGRQKYSFTVPDEIFGYSMVAGGENFTVDWLTPVSMPLFAGVEAYNALAEYMESDGNYDMRDVLNATFDAIAATADPITNLSMLSGVKNAVGNLQNGLSPIDLGLNVAESYALQFIPTASGQMGRFINPQRKTTYAPTDSAMVGGKRTETFLNKVKNKSLLYNIADAVGAVEGNAAYVDQWGRTEDGTKNFAVRAIEQFIAPWYARDYNSTEVDDKLAVLYEKNGGDSAIFPETPTSYVKIDGVTYHYNPSWYEKIKKTVGQLSYSGVASAFDYGEFNGLDAATQTDILDSIYKYANQMAKIDFAKSQGLNVWVSDSEKKKFLKTNPDASGFVQDSNVAKIEEASRAGISIGQYFTIKAVVNGLKGKEKKAKLKELGVPKNLYDLF